MGSWHKKTRSLSPFLRLSFIMIYDLIIQYLQTKYSFILIMPKYGTYAILFKLKK